MTATGLARLTGAMALALVLPAIGYLTVTTWRLRDRLAAHEQAEQGIVEKIPELEASISTYVQSAQVRLQALEAQVAQAGRAAEVSPTPSGSPPASSVPSGGGRASTTSDGRLAQLEAEVADLRITVNALVKHLSR